MMAVDGERGEEASMMAVDGERGEEALATQHLPVTTWGM